VALKNAEVGFYFDADSLGLAHVVCALRPDCTYPGDPGRKIKRQIRSACAIQPDAKDREWIPVVASLGWVAITRDKDIQSHLSLLQLVKEYQLRMVTLTGPDAGTPWSQLGIIVPQWHRIEALAERTGPIVVAATRTSFREIDIDEAIERIRVGRERRRRRPTAQTGDGLQLF
jgi:hypothetical protein